MTTTLICTGCAQKYTGARGTLVTIGLDLQGKGEHRCRGVLEGIKRYFGGITLGCVWTNYGRSSGRMDDGNWRKDGARRRGTVDGERRIDGANRTLYGRREREHGRLWDRWNG